jgi:hypothetical protein
VKRAKNALLTKNALLRLIPVSVQAASSDSSALSNGWAIAQRIRQMSGDVLQVGQGALYPCLHKLEQNGWIRAEWGIGENNRRAKYYTLTKAGRKITWPQWKSMRPVKPTARTRRPSRWRGWLPA